MTMATIFRNIPLIPDPRKEGQLNLIKLREAVQSRGRLRDARLILSFEVGFHPDEVAKQQACLSLIEACKHPGRVEPVWAVEGAVRSMLAQSYRRVGDFEAAEKETNLALNLLKTAPVPLDQNRAHLTVWLDQMKATKYSNCRESFAAWIEFSEREPVKTDSMMLSNALGKLADAALEILQASPSVENKAVFWEWELRNESLLEQSGDVYFLYLSKLFTGQVALSLFDELGAVLRWQEEFQGRYPDFNLWAHLVAGKRTLAQVYHRLEQQDQVIKTFGEISEIMRQRDDFWTEDANEGGQYAPQNVSNLDPVGQNSTTSEEMPAFKAENLREEWLSEWVHTAQIGFGKEFKDFSVALGPQLARGADPYMTTLLRWLKAAVNDGTITETELEYIIMNSKAGRDAQGHDAVEAIQELVPSTLRVHLYGPDSQLVSSARWANIFRLLQDWLLHRVGYNETKRHVLLGQLQTERLDSLIPTPRNSEILQEAERMLDLVPTLCEEAQQQFKGATMNWRNIACLAKKELQAQQNPEALWNEELPEFREVLDMYTVSLKESRDRGSLPNEAATLLSMAQHYYQGALLLRPNAVAAFIEYLDASDTVYNKSRESWKVLKGWAKVEKLLSAVQEQMRLMIAPLAASVMSRFPSNDGRAKGLWTIVQMAKSNGLGWLMRTTASTEGNQIAGSDRVDVEFEELPVLTPEELKPLGLDAGGNVIFVDWYNGSMPGREMPNPIMLSLSPDGSIATLPVSLTWSEINGIIDKFSFEESDLRKSDASKELQRLNPLVEPLAAATEPGQTLVFSSIGSLHRLPLHALAINGETLIERNPIVYCSSLTALNVAYKARRSAEQLRQSERIPFHASLFGDPPTQPGKKALASLAQAFRTEAQIGDASTSSNLTSALREPRLTLLHYHGHVTFQEGDPKDHGLELDDRRFTLRDIFDLAPLPNSYHATLLGCGSGMSKTTVSNDVVGLVPAFLYSGASSTVSTLWPFDDKDAAMYTRHFYEDFHRCLQAGGEEEGLVDLAKANQKAVLAIREKRPALYHWAPFVLNGYWMYRLGRLKEGYSIGNGNAKHSPLRRSRPADAEPPNVAFPCNRLSFPTTRPLGLWTWLVLLCDYGLLGRRHGAKYHSNVSRRVAAQIVLIGKSPAAMYGTVASWQPSPSPLNPLDHGPSELVVGANKLFCRPFILCAVPPRYFSPPFSLFSLHRQQFLHCAVI
ncbi:MAG: hypothetical protein Q9197_000540 [Variospora fuerteventurae]